MYAQLYIALYRVCSNCSDMSNISNGVHCGGLIFQEDGQTYPAANGEDAKWCIGITWHIVGPTCTEGRYCHLGYCRDTPWLFTTPAAERDQGIAELIAQYYAFKYLKQFPTTLEILFVTDRIATLQTIEACRRKRDDELPDLPFDRLLRLVRFEFGQCMQRHGMILVKHKNYLRYTSSTWTADWYARTPERPDLLAPALLPENRERYMPGLPTVWIPPIDAINATACVYFINKIWFPRANGCLAAVTLILNGALGALERRLKFAREAVKKHADEHGPFVID